MSDPAPPDSTIPFLRLMHCLQLMLEDYAPEAKSKHWSDNFTPEFLDKLADQSNLLRFRAGRKDKLSFGLDDEGKFLATMDTFEDFVAHFGKDFLDAYAEARVGSPPTYRIGAKRYNYNDIFVVRFLHAICDHLSPDSHLVCEIGGGYGSMAHKLKTRFPGCTIVILDLPEATALQMHYLPQLHPDAKFLLYDEFKDMGCPDLTAAALSEFDFVLLPGWAAPHLPGQAFDLFINTRSMMEMEKSVIEGYFETIQRCLRPGGIFYNVNRYEKKTVGYPVRISEYPYDRRWKVLSSKPSWRQHHIHELIAARTETESPDIQEVLDSLPKAGVRVHHPRRSLGRKLVLPCKAAWYFLTGR